MSYYKDELNMKKPDDFILDEICLLASVDNRAIKIRTIELTLKEAKELLNWLNKASLYLEIQENINK